MLAKHVEKLFEEFKSQGWSDERKAELFADFLREDEHTDDFLDWLHGKYGADEGETSRDEAEGQYDEDLDDEDEEYGDEEEEGDEGSEAQPSSGEAMIGNIPQEELWGG